MATPIITSPVWLTKYLSNGTFAAGIRFFYFVLACSCFDRSLWLDETVTYWVVKDGWAEAMHRATEFQGQTPFFYLLCWAWTKLFGLNEVTLRLPSIIALLCSSYALNQLLRRCGHPNAALTAELVFLALTYPFIAARPYTLALFFGVFSTLLLCRYFQEERRSLAVGYVLTSVCLVASHYCFFPILAVHFMFVLLWHRNRKNLRVMLLLFSAIVFLSLPSFSQLSKLQEKSSLYSFAPQPTVESYLSSLNWDGWPIRWLVLISLIQIILSKGRWSDQLPVKSLSWFFFWWIFPNTLFATVSAVGSTSVFIDRYFAWSIPGCASVIAILATSAPSFLSRSLCVVLLILPLIALKPDRNFREDWRGAIETVNARRQPEDHVFLWTGFVESRDPNWLLDREKADYLRAPLAPYPLLILPGLLPWDPSKSSIESILPGQSKAMLRAGTLWVIVRLLWLEDTSNERGSILSAHHIESWLRRNNLELQSKWDVGGLSVMRFSLPDEQI